MTMTKKNVGNTKDRVRARQERTRSLRAEHEAAQSQHRDAGETAARSLADGDDADCGAVAALQSRVAILARAIEVAEADEAAAIEELRAEQRKAADAVVAGVEARAATLGASFRDWIGAGALLAAQIDPLQAEFDRARNSRGDKRLDERITEQMAVPNLKNIRIAIERAA